ncbi:hypothetical protein JL722_7934 [Aureococcus anophagefferens]|nr:hypothetical protein JL722_7934 [Aureococcus anophagefferens]
MGLPDRPILAPALRAGDTVTIASTKTLAKMASDWDPAAGGPCRVLRVGAGGDAASPRLVDRNDLVRGDVVDQRRVGPLLYRASLELKCETRAAPAVCFVSCYGLVAERAVLLHGVEPSTASVSVYALGERELRALCAAGGDEPAAALLARWLGTEGRPRRTSGGCRADWTTVLRWVCARLSLAEEAGGLVLACDDLAAPPAPPAPSPRPARAPDFEDVGDVAVGAFAAEAYDRICAAAGDARGRRRRRASRTSRAARPPSATTAPRAPRRSATRRSRPRRAAGSPRGVADRAYADAVAAALETVDAARPRRRGAGYADVRSAALAAVESDAIRRRKRLPPAASRPHAKHLVIEAKIDALEREIEAKLRIAQGGDAEPAALASWLCGGVCRGLWRLSTAFRTVPDRRRSAAEPPPRVDPLA